MSTHVCPKASALMPKETEQMLLISFSGQPWHKHLERSKRSSMYLCRLHHNVSKSCKTQLAAHLQHPPQLFQRENYKSARASEFTNTWPSYNPFRFLTLIVVQPCVLCNSDALLSYAWSTNSVFTCSDTCAASATNMNVGSFFPRQCWQTARSPGNVSLRSPRCNCGITSRKRHAKKLAPVSVIKIL